MNNSIAIDGIITQKRFADVVGRNLPIQPATFFNEEFDNAEVAREAKMMLRNVARRS
jgi:hypothetical protein